MSANHEVCRKALPRRTRWNRGPRRARGIVRPSARSAGRRAAYGGGRTWNAPHAFATVAVFVRVHFLCAFVPLWRRFLLPPCPPWYSFFCLEVVAADGRR